MQQKQRLVACIWDYPQEVVYIRTCFVGLFYSTRNKLCRKAVGDMLPGRSKVSRTEHIVRPLFVVASRTGGESSWVNTHGETFKGSLEISILLFYGWFKNLNRRDRNTSNVWSDHKMEHLFCLVFCEEIDPTKTRLIASFVLLVRSNNDNALY